MGLYHTGESNPGAPSHPSGQVGFMCGSWPLCGSSTGCSREAPWGKHDFRLPSSLGLGRSQSSVKFTLLLPGSESKERPYGKAMATALLFPLNKSWLFRAPVQDL